MHTLFELGMSNLVMAGLLSIVAVALGLVVRRPAFVHGLWLLVFLKLITPPIISAPIFAPVNHDLEKVRSNAKPVKPLSAPALPRPRHPIAIDQSSPRAEFFDSKSIEHFEADELFGDQSETQTTPSPKAVTKSPKEAESRHPPVIPKKTNGDSSPAHVAGWTWYDVLATPWLAGAVVWFAIAILRLVRFQRLLQFAQPASDMLQQQAQKIAEVMGVRCPSVRVMPGVVAPFVWVMGRRRWLLVPSDLQSRLNGEQMSTLLAHELAHLRRHDHWVRWLEMVVLGLYWWCPLVWWARGRLQQAEEECCDAWVVWALPNLTRAYASTLMETVDFLAEARSPLPIGASGFGQVQQLKRRLTMILRGKTPRTLKITGFVMLFVVAGFLLPLAPGFADRPGEEGEKRVEKGDREDERGEKKREKFRGEKEREGERSEKKRDGERGEKKRDDDRGEKKREGDRGDKERDEKEFRKKFGGGDRPGVGNLREWAAKLERMKRDLDEQRRLLEKKAQMLDLQFKRLREAQERLRGDKDRPPFEKPPRFPDKKDREFPRFPGAKPNPRVMNRLGELEEQLHRILKEIHELRKQAGPGRPRFPGSEQPRPKFKPRPDGDVFPKPKFRPNRRPEKDEEDEIDIGGPRTAVQPAIAPQPKLASPAAR